MVGKLAAGDSALTPNNGMPVPDGVFVRSDVADRQNPRTRKRGRVDATAGPSTTGGPSTASPSTTEQLLGRYRLRRSAAILDEVVERYRGAVESMAYSLATRLPRSVDVQDLSHAGMWGLLQAISSFQPERCDAFEPFMRIRVRGAMLDELRHMDFLPRLFRRRVRERDAASARLRMDLEREPTNTELAEALGITEDVLIRCPDSNVIRSVHWREADADEDQFEHLADDGLESPIEPILRQELLDMVRQQLEPIEWKVLKLHYLDGLTGRQVARRLRLSASRICQIHVTVLDRLKQQFTVATV